MSESHEAEGSCLCGAVRISTNEMRDAVGACHCGMCRKWGGGPLLAVDCGSGVRIEGEDQVSVYDSSAWAERGFCARCGSHLFYRLKQDGRYLVPAGLFGDRHVFRLRHQVFIDDKPGYYAFAQRTTELTAREVFEKYAPRSDHGTDG